jgi:hypothetical protein
LIARQKKGARVMATAAKQFELIAREAREKASMVNCTVEEYIAGIEEVIEILQESIDAAREIERGKRDMAKDDDNETKP